MKKTTSYFLFLLFISNSLYAADRFWVGGTGAWSNSAKWSDISGGLGGFPVPTSLDDVFFDDNSFTGTGQFVNIDIPAFCKNMTWTSDSLPQLVGPDTLNIYGSLLFNAGMTYSRTGITYFRATTPVDTITTAGKIFLGDVRFNGVGGEWSLMDNFQTASGIDIYLDNGSLNTNNYDMTCRSFLSSNTNTRELILNSSMITIRATWNLSDITNLTFDAGTSTILFNVPFSSTNFFGGNLTYYDLNASGINSITITGSNTFNMLSVSPGVFPVDLILEIGQTQTVTNLDVVGVPGVRVNIKSTTGGITSTISKASGVVCTDWLTIKDNVATGGATFYAGANSINNFNTFGWIFSDCPPKLTTSISGVSVSCNGLCDGTAIVTPIDGVPPYTYLWSTIPVQTDSTATGLCPGIYTVIVNDEVPDTAYDTIVISEPFLLTADITDSTNALCKDECNGTAEVTGAGGTIPYTYSWNTVPVQTTKIATGLCADTLYIATVTDARGCDTTTSVILSEPDSLLSGAPSVTNVTCKGLCDGTATVAPTGGTRPYTYVWDDPLPVQTDSIADSLCAATYNVLVTDANGCTSVSSPTITEPAAVLTATITGSTDPLCGSVCDGTSTVTAAGGTPPYTYLWNDPLAQTSSTADSLCGSPAGIIYTVTVTDANGCDTTASDTIFAPPPLTSSITDSTNLSCGGVGLCDGTATVTPAGGVPPYTYSWNTTPIQTDSVATILCDTPYTVTVTDANGCADSTNVLLIAPDTLTATIVSSTNATCFNTCDGSATVRAEGGTTPYTFSWAPIGGTDSIADSLCAGFYTVTVTDSKGCDTTDTITITEPTVISSTASVSCAGSCDGIAIVTPVGGTPPYSYQWYDSFFDTIPGETDSILDSLCTGTYCVVTTDSNSCTDSTCIIISLPTITLSTTNPSCNGVCDGDATVIAAGGFPPYTYIWTNAAGDTISTDTIADTLCAGQYYIELTDNVGCVLKDTVDIIDPAVLTSGITDSTNALCNGDCNGTATVTASGGTPPYTYSWTTTPVQTGSTATGLCAGIDTVTVTDSRGCDTTSTVTISNPPLLTAAITGSADASCGGTCDGTATVTAGGGTGAYTYSWNTVPAQTTPTATGLCADTAGTTYIIVVTDSNGCTETDSVKLFEPAPLVTTMTTDSNASCSGLCDGGATVTPSGGTPPYTYSWSNGDTGPTADSLCAGTYIVTVTDDSGCVAIDSVSITESVVLTAAITPGTPISCGGVCDGTATVTPGGGTLPYTYLWSPSAGGQTTSLAINLCAGTHYVTVTDTNGCTAADTVIITEPPVLTASITDSVNVSCNGLCDGYAIVTPVGGTPPYTYAWDDPPPIQTDSTADSLCAGIYNVLITDFNLCTTTAGITITQPLPLTSIILPASGTCGGVCDVQAVVTPSDGTPPYTYSWTTIPVQTDSTATGLCGGKYYAIVTDANGCTVTDSVTVSMPDTLILYLTGTTPADCGGGCTGTATDSATGGTGLYTFLWSNGDTLPTADSLCAATYWAYVTDANGCVDSLQVAIPATGGLSALISAFTNVSCNAACDGDATVSVIGGALPYSYQWYDSAFAPIGDTLSFADSLCAGKYYAVVTDNNGCIATSDTVTITEPGIFTSFICDSTDVSCNGVCDGSAAVCVVGGVPPFTYLWNPGGQVNDTVINLCAGTYFATVTDANGCPAIDSITINQPAPLSIAFVTTPINCNGTCDATATAIVAGGTPPYTYSWTNGDITAVADSLCAGTHIVTVTDSNGCVIIDSVSFIAPTVITLDSISTVSAGCTICNGQATVRASGGLPPYTYLWNTIPAQFDTTATGLCASIYTATVTDASGCDTAISVTIPGAGGLTFSISVDSMISCAGICDAQVTVTPSGGTAPYSHSWSNGKNTATIDSLCAGTYSDTITDNNGCIAIAPVIITSPGVFISSFTDSSDVTCNGACDGTGTVTPTGGTLPYTYEWTNSLFVPIGQTDSTATGLCPGIYNVSVSDANGCNTSNTGLSITEPPPFSASITDSTNVSCNGFCDGSATVTAAGGILPLTYLWFPSGDTSTTADSLCAGIHTIAVTDSSGCVRTDSVLITEPAVFAIDTIIPTPPSCKDTCDGQATVVIVGGSGGFIYLWDDIGAQTTQTATGLCDGIYNVTVTDTGGCGADSSGVTITEPLLLTASITSTTDATCGGLCDGTATVTASGGTGAYTYLWSPSGGTGSIETGICEGVDTVTVTDANGCIAMSYDTINAPDTLKVDTLSMTPSQCLPICDGDATVFASGGIAPYIYSWNTGPVQTDSTATGLCISTYIATVTDDSGCVATLDVIITGPNGFFSTIDTLINATCFGDCDGEAVVFAAGGFPPYTYSWDTLGGGTIPGETDTIINSLCADGYIAVVTDNTGCISTAPFTINEPAVFSAAITDSTPVSCFGDSNGTATVTATGGATPYTYSWSNGDTGPTADSLPAGIHSVIVTSANGCGADTLSVNITGVSSPLTAVITDSADISCFAACNGSATVSAGGGTPPYTYLWSPSGGVDSIADSLCSPGTYCVTVTDSSGCAATACVTITEPTELIAVVFLNQKPSCFGLCDGWTEVTVSGGVPPYTYSWNNGDSGLVADSLCAGIYTVTVTDSINCVTTSTDTINDPAILTSSITDIKQAVCDGLPSGSATVTPAGGTPPYTYSWNPNPIPPPDSIADSLYAGEYCVTITDANGCIDSSCVTITDTSDMAASIDTINNISCFGAMDGEMTVTVTGSTTPYTYLWNDWLSTTDSTVIALDTPGTYCVRVTSFGNCVRYECGTITEPTALTSVITDSTDADCGAICNGTATVSVSGGTPPYTYLWDNNQTSSFADSLCLGINIVTITDTNGCAITDSVDILAPPALTASNIVSNTNCSTVNGGAIDLTVTGGIPPYTYLWSPGGNTTQDLTNIFAGTYAVTITDSIGCSITDTAIVSALVTMNAGPDALICAGDTAILTATVAGDSFSWSTGDSDTSISVSPGITTEYILIAGTVACTDTVVVNVVVIDAGEDITIANGGGDTLSASGGTGYSWTPSAGLSDTTISNPFANPFETTVYYVTDLNGCVDSVTVIVQEGFPDGITPNGDGINDTWELDFLRDFPDVSVEVYNRWGERVFESRKGEKYANRFDGTFEGKELPVGTFYYIINLNDGTEPLTGPITIMR